MGGRFETAGRWLIGFGRQLVPVLVVYALALQVLLPLAMAAPERGPLPVICAGTPAGGGPSVPLSGHDCRLCCLHPVAGLPPPAAAAAPTTVGVALDAMAPVATAVRPARSDGRPQLARAPPRRA